MRELSVICVQFRYFCLSGCYILCNIIARVALNLWERSSTEVFPYNSKSIGAAFTRAVRLLGLSDLHFHDLRHEATSRLFETGFDIPEVAHFTCTSLGPR
ncbi:MAG: tyrosine-type recombinase/integrase [Xanthomonadaceae bacterium]|nr:tyrosine-type recombinase/integrase [Xanthomonadaceae bacterium]MDP2185293.1 tyrosine-type recombinase/integrase [Xanthomonadales bacterium]MDZ4115832.1 tyrosine-type recombinase/integrase [Xanthomonadaceae bacterium]MDZ4378661.1 tyrosine-type recombinase/integrase [Xanthomonadaceae bacterium]